MNKTPKQQSRQHVWHESGLLTSNPDLKAQFLVHSTDSKAPKREAHKTGSLWICKVREYMLFGSTEGKADIRCGCYI